MNQQTVKVLAKEFGRHMKPDIFPGHVDVEAGDYRGTFAFNEQGDIEPIWSEGNWLPFPIRISVRDCYGNELSNIVLVQDHNCEAQ